MPSDCKHGGCTSRYLGVDPQEGRFADVTLYNCQACGAQWLRYQIEVEGITGSGRWYEGQLTPEQAAALTPANAAALLEAMPTYVAGGSYFGGRVHPRSGPLA